MEDDLGSTHQDRMIATTYRSTVYCTAPLPFREIGNFDSRGVQSGFSRLELSAWNLFQGGFTLLVFFSSAKIGTILFIRRESLETGL